MKDSPKVFWLIAECTPGPFYMGWHLYLRESWDYQTRNADGGWGWIRRPKETYIAKLLSGIGCEITGDGTCDHDGICRFAKLFPLPGRRIAGKRRAGAVIIIDGTAMSFFSPLVP